MKPVTYIHDVSIPPGSVVTIGNILYVFLFGWWISLIYILICPIMFLTLIGAPYGMYCITDSISLKITFSFQFLLNIIFFPFKFKESSV